MITTPSGLDYTRLTPADMVKVNINTLEYMGAQKPTSEKGIHASVYRMRKEVGAVIHTHSKYCAIFAAAGKGYAHRRSPDGRNLWETSEFSSLWFAGDEETDEKYYGSSGREFRMYYGQSRNACLW